MAMKSSSFNSTTCFDRDRPDDMYARLRVCLSEFLCASVSSHTSNENGGGRERDNGSCLRRCRRYHIAQHPARTNTVISFS